MIIREIVLNAPIYDPTFINRNISNNGMPIIKINSEFICLKLISFIEIKHYTH